MADYFPLLSRAVAGQDLASRQAIYARARAALERQLRGFEPPLGDAAIAAELESLAATVARLESELAPVVPAREVPGDPPAKAVGGDAATPREIIAAPGVIAEGDEPPRQDPAPQTASEPATEVTEEPAAAPARPAAPPPDQAPPPDPEPAAPPPDAPVITAVPRPRLPERGKRPMRSRALALFAAVGIIAMLLMGMLALTSRSTVERPAGPPLVTAPPAQDGDPDSGKTEGRLASVESAPKAGEEKTSTQPLTPPQPSVAPQTGETQQPPPTAAAPVASRTFLVLEVPGSAPNQFEGVANWSFLPDPLTGGTKTLRAVIDFPSAAMSIELAMTRNTDPALNASHTIMVIFDPKIGIENVREMSALEWRERENQTGTLFAGIVVPVQDNVFMVGLDKSEAGVTRNIGLLREQKWMVFEFRLVNGRRGAVLIEKGIDGEKAVADALAEWR